MFVYLCLQIIDLLFELWLGGWLDGAYLVLVFVGDFEHFLGGL